MDVGDEFADWSKTLRAAMGWSQKEAAKKCGVSPGYIGLIETSERIPSAKRVEEMVRNLVEAGVPVGLEDVIEVRNQARQQLGLRALEALGTGKVEVDEVTHLLAAADRDDASPAKSTKRKVGRPSRAQRLREDISEKCADLDEAQLHRLLGYMDHLIEEHAASQR